MSILGGILALGLVCTCLLFGFYSTVIRREQLLDRLGVCDTQEAELQMQQLEYKASCKVDRGGANDVARCKRKNLREVRG